MTSLSSLGTKDNRHKRSFVSSTSRDCYVLFKMGVTSASYPSGNVLVVKEVLMMDLIVGRIEARQS